ncbi:MAG: pyridoxamine 5-phosphate oxidase [Chloroflexi bacterium]|nr:pyridoxamine 5-phosphate oxidase [Chloroflexota bacterium]
MAITTPEVAELVRRIFEAHRTGTLATLRKDWSPRMSGIDAEFVEGEAVVGTGPNSHRLMHYATSVE